MGKSKWKVGMASALAVGAGARRLKRAIIGIRSVENRRRTARGSIIPAETMKLLRGRRSRKVLKENLHTWLEVVWLH